MSRFDEYGMGPDGAQAHVTEYENDELATDELQQKLNALIEGNEDEALIEAVYAELRARARREMRHAARGRRHGSVRFATYFKLQVWEPRSHAWRDIQKQCATEEEARMLLPSGARGRIMRISERGREPVLELKGG